MDFEKAKQQMISQQLRTNQVLDENILELMRTIPREKFMKPGFEKLAYADSMPPIGFGQISLSPKIIGSALQNLQITKHETILEIGTGTGYITSLLANLGKKVISVEIDPKLAQLAEKNLVELGIDNVSLEVGDGARGWDLLAPVDVVVITGSMPVLPQSFKEILNVGGRIFAILGTAPAMRTVMLTRDTLEVISSKNLFETVVPVLQHAPSVEQFVF